MFQSVLVQNTVWGSVEKTCALIGDKLTPEYVSGLPAEELERLITPCGFYRAKAWTVKTLAAWFQKYFFDRERVMGVPLPELRKELLANVSLLFTPQSITTLIGWEDACCALNRIQPLAEGDLKWAEFVTVRWLASEL